MISTKDNVNNVGLPDARLALFQLTFIMFGLSLFVDAVNGFFWRVWELTLRYPPYLKSPY